jgi:hypothetical protein
MSGSDECANGQDYTSSRPSDPGNKWSRLLDFHLLAGQCVAEYRQSENDTEYGSYRAAAGNLLMWRAR